MDRRAFLAVAGSLLASACTPGGFPPLAGLLEPTSSEPHRVAPVNLATIPQQYRRQIVGDPTGEAPGTIVVDPGKRHLYLVMENGRAMRYGVGVGREGFGWSGAATIKRKAKWPTWTPPKEMQERDPQARKFANGMPGGPTNPLGARALYLYQGNRDTLYRIHGTNEPQSIGRAVSSGCIRLLNADVIDLYDRVPIGTRVVVRPVSSNFLARLGQPAKPAPDADSDWRASVKRLMARAG